MVQSALRTVSASVHRKADFICTGLHDEQIINTAAASLPNGGVLLLLAGCYHLSGSIHLKYPNITVLGENAGQTILYQKSNLSGALICVEAPDITLDSLCLYGLPKAHGDGIRTIKTENCFLHGIRCANFSGNGAMLTGQNHAVEHCVMEGNTKNGILALGCSSLLVSDCNFYHNGNHGLLLSGVGARLHHNYCSDNEKNGFQIFGTHHIAAHNTFEFNNGFDTALNGSAACLYHNSYTSGGTAAVLSLGQHNTLAYNHIETECSQNGISLPHNKTQILYANTFSHY